MTPQRDRLDAAFVAAYDELRRLAGHMQRQDPGVTFDPTGLVNEAWIKLSGSPDVADTSPLHFKRIAARAMRQVLVEAARRLAHVHLARVVERDRVAEDRDEHVDRRARLHRVARGVLGERRRRDDRAIRRIEHALHVGHGAHHQ